MTLPQSQRSPGNSLGSAAGFATKLQISRRGVWFISICSGPILRGFPKRIESGGGGPHSQRQTCVSSAGWREICSFSSPSSSVWNTGHWKILALWFHENLTMLPKEKKNMQPNIYFPSILETSVVGVPDFSKLRRPLLPPQPWYNPASDSLSSNRLPRRPMRNELAYRSS